MVFIFNHDMVSFFYGDYMEKPFFSNKKDNIIINLVYNDH